MKVIFYKVLKIFIKIKKTCEFLLIQQNEYGLLTLSNSEIYYTLVHITLPSTVKIVTLSSLIFPSGLKALGKCAGFGTGLGQCAMLLVQ